MTKKILYSGFIGFLLLNFLSAQSHTYTGKIVDIRNGAELQGVTVATSKLAVFTDEFGKFEIELPDSIRTVLVKMVGYKEFILSLTEPSDLIIELEPESYLLNTTVITSSRFEKPIEESPVSISVIKASLSDRLSTNSCAQLLDRVPGVQIIDGQANIRGGSGYSYGAGSRVLLLLDDLPVLNPDAGYPNWDDLPLENLGQIEILKGASSSLYGSSAMNGIIHFRTNFPGSDPFTSISFIPKVYLNPSSGKQWWGKDSVVAIPYEGIVNFVHRKRYSWADLSASMSFTSKTGYNKDHNSKNGRIHLLVRKRIHDRFTLNLGLNYNQGESSSFFYWKDNGYFEGAPGSSSSSNKIRFTIDPSVNYESKNGFQHKLKTRFYHVFNGADNNQENKSNNIYTEYQIGKSFKKLGLQCLAGTLYTQSWTIAELYSDTRFTHRNLAFFGQIEKSLFSRLILSGGLRYESYQINGPESLSGVSIDPKVTEDTTLFRFGINYRVFKATYLRGSYGQGYRFPTIAEKFISTKAGGLSIVPNPNLHSERGSSFELGMKQLLKFENLEGLIDFSIFQSRYYDMMEFVLNNQLQFQSRNIGDTDIRGFELELLARMQMGETKLTFGGGYTFINPKYLEFDLAGKQLPINGRDTASRAKQNAANSSSDENILKYRSKHLFRSDLQVDYKSFYMGMAFNYASHMHAVDWLFELNVFIKGIKDYRTTHNHGYRVYDFRMGYHFAHLDFQINVDNLFNEDYSIRPGILNAPRNLTLRGTYTF
ncbi:MAG: TonB-dependent receptor [Saprospiraceae bacterium]|nr:TonB-dependent receptor [Saprospiraceae bacterium]